MSFEGPYARLYDACEARGWQLQLAGTEETGVIIEIHRPHRKSSRRAAGPGGAVRAFRVPRGRTIDEAATALLHELAGELREA